MNYRLVTVSFFLVLLSIGSFGQDTLNIFRSINWQVDNYELKENKRLFPAIYFDNAILEAGNASVPAFQHQIEIPQDKELLSLELRKQQFRAISLDDFDDEQLQDLPREIQVDHLTGMSRSHSFLNVLIRPLYFNQTNDSLYLLTNFSIQAVLVEKDNQVEPFKQSAFTGNSVLSSGNWFKVRVQSNGIYRITYNDLKEMGMDVDNINPLNLAVYGNPAGMLPEANDASVYSDLSQLGVSVQGEGDGSFDAGDYILFYGQSPDVWKFNQAENVFHNSFNVYSNYTYYFITADLGPGKRIEVQNNSGLQANRNISKYNDFYLHKRDEVNILGTGRKWLEHLEEDKFELNTIFSNLYTGAAVFVNAKVVARSFSSSSFSLQANGSLLGQVTVQKVIEGSLNDFARSKMLKSSFNASSEQLDIAINYNKTHSSGTSWLDYLELNFMRQLRMKDAQFGFRSLESLGDGNVSEFTISDVTGNLQVWDVTDPNAVSRIEGQLSGSTFKFKSPTDILREYIAFDGSSFYSVEFVKKVSNQDLHGIETPKMLVITYPDFINAAKRLVDYHKSNEGMKVQLCTTQEVYNEFSSGAQDITAIRNFARMLYQRPDGDHFKYLMLFGDASYDYKNRIEDNTNFVPSWESEASFDMINSYVTDDYYGLLDENEGRNIPTELLDLGIGRIPVRSISEAHAIVEKILHYAANQPVVMEPWRTWVSFIADDEDGNLHVRQAEELAEYVEMQVKNLNVDKIYLDSYTQESTPSGQRYPEVTEKINNRIEQGALVVNYTGHGGELGLAHEQILSIGDINKWNNYDNLPIFITATCEFARFDDPTRTSAGELVFLNRNGGAIAMFTTARATYAGSNLALNKQFYRKAFEKVNGEYPRMGDIIRLSKTAVSTGINKRKYVLLGDPALQMAYPLDSVISTKINGIEISEVPDTLKALAEVSIQGSVYSCEGYKLDNFNGTVFTTVFDKATRLSTFGQDNNSTPKDFYLRKNIVYKGKSPAENGDFEFTFIVPKDIAYNFGYGRISMYATDNGMDAVGYNENIIVGGFSDITVPDTLGPDISLFMNDTTFRKGGITDEDPHLLAFLNDQSGINTVGNGIGHDITAIIDGESQTPFILNDFYEADLGGYSSGSILYPFLDLPEGEHSLELKVWDVYNNSSTAKTSFIVVRSSDFRIEKLMNYPNPFAHETSFVFEHNQAGEELDVEINIFSLHGDLVSKIKQKIVSGGYMSTPIKWEGTTVNGAKLKQGFYIYRLIVANEAGEVLEKSGKLILTDY